MNRDCKYREALNPLMSVLKTNLAKVFRLVLKRV